MKYLLLSRFLVFMGLCQQLELDPKWHNLSNRKIEQISGSPATGAA